MKFQWRNVALIKVLTAVQKAIEVWAANFLQLLSINCYRNQCGSSGRRDTSIVVWRTLLRIEFSKRDGRSPRPIWLNELNGTRWIKKKTKWIKNTVGPIAAHISIDLLATAHKFFLQKKILVSFLLGTKLLKLLMTRKFNQRTI